MPTLADLIAQKLSEARVDVVFGLPGGENVDLLDALRRRSIEFVLVRNESSAVFMADAHARLTGGIGVALTTLGPGAANAYVGLAHAWLDRSPVLLLTAQTDPRLIGRHTHQVLELQSIFQPVTKFTALLLPDFAEGTISQALRRLRLGRPGPVHLSVSSAHASAPVDDDSQPQPPASAPDWGAPIERAKRILSSSPRPIIVAGLGLEPDKPYAQLRALAERFHAPVIDTPKSKGVIPSDHPLFVGTLGLTMDDPACEILDASDCILAVGFDPVEIVKPWDQPQSLIWISNWENEDPHLDSACELIGDISGSLAALLEAAPGAGDDWGEGFVSAWRETRPLRGQPGIAPAPNRVFPADVLDSLRENVPPETILTTDVGSHKIYTCLYWKAMKPNTFLVSNGLSSMGFGLTSAIAAARATREPVVCITGDAGLAMMMGELSLLVELDLPVIVVVMNDSALDLIRFAQTKKDFPVFGSEFTNPDYEKIASAFGLSFAKITNKNECDLAIKSAAASRKPTLLEVMIDPAGYR
jgi:acetolactate synthase-1/2/3 large subunit